MAGIMDKPNKIKAKLIVEVEAEFYDDESSEETLRYCVEQDLEDAGFNVIDVSVMEWGDIMKTEESLREVIIHDVYSRLDSLGYGKKQSGAGYIYYIVNGKQMTVSEYTDYCIKMELKKFGIKKWRFQKEKKNKDEWWYEVWIYRNMDI